MRSQLFFILASLLAVAAAAPTATVNERSGTDSENAGASTVAPAPAWHTYDNPTNFYCGIFPKGLPQVVIGAPPDMTATAQGQTCVGAGPAACVNLTPKNSTKLSLCNDNKYPKCVDNSDIHWRAVSLWQECGNFFNQPWSGQAFFSDHTNLIFEKA